jgi:hypothetical protein
MDSKPDKEYENQGDIGFISARILSFFPNADLVIYHENSSFFWTLSGAMKPSPSMGFPAYASLQTGS